MANTQTLDTIATPLKLSDGPAPDDTHGKVEEIVADLDVEAAITIEEKVQPALYADKIATTAYLNEYIARHPIPKIHGNLRWLWLRYGFFTVYRRLYAIVLVANIIALAVVASRGMQVGYMDAALGVSVNILATVLARWEPLGNLVVGLVNLVPLSWPLWFRIRLAKIYCHAGIHSACGTSAAIWYLYFTILLALQSVSASEGIRVAIYFITVLQLTSLLAMVALAHPWVRSRYHNLWEYSHRFLGWLITTLVFIQVFLLATMSERSLGDAIVHSPSFWMVLLVILILLYPWITMRKRTFVATQLSDHALRLDFDYRSARSGHNIRLSHSPLFENHGFACIPRPDGERGFSIIISNAGDWTKGIVSSTTRKNSVWVRGRLFLGIIETPKLFAPLVVAATGSGIAPCLAFIQTHPEWPVRVVWSARAPLSTYGNEIIEMVLRADPQAIIIDTKTTGRPDFPALIYAAYKDINAEAILCVSTQRVCETVSFEMDARGVPIYVPIFDS